MRLLLLGLAFFLGKLDLELILIQTNGEGTIGSFLFIVFLTWIIISIVGGVIKSL